MERSVHHAGSWAWALVLPSVFGAGGTLIFAAAFADSTKVALITSAPSMLAAVVAGGWGWLNHKQGTQIHLLVNSNMAAMDRKLSDATVKIEELRVLLAKTESAISLNKIETLQAQLAKAESVAASATAVAAVAIAAQPTMLIPSSLSSEKPTP